ncbi:cadherin-like beta sandwich domain-containing protein [Sediminispirochaeta smaragdinae]|uniref:Cadherin-like beta-sandwich-like domain-containing protein n=1 Tax=Sediminispirochaeta smaragdinae (strain DSM 11293 / JCM 15392 / SEBR 4228) TaxID=573413 RepID=E1RAT3_SEDSS|nr:cadherin-like beta sandwich domain-containing protein [Sediminispirochaeta smaragdinae]ADK82451.1 hypothetical protein Spirs_3357 [Sediminispirochaeta smaragdinae DSM 11293]
MMCWKLFKKITALLVVLLLVGFTMSCNLFGGSDSDDDDDGGGGSSGGTSELITITNPAAGAVVTTETITVSGTWSGTTPDSIDVSLEGNEVNAKIGNKTWSATFTPLTKGSKLIWVTSYDADDEEIADTTIIIDYEYSLAAEGHTVTISNISKGSHTITSGYLYAFLSKNEYGDPAYISAGEEITASTSWSSTSISIENVGDYTDGYYVEVVVLENDINSTPYKSLFIGSAGSTTISLSPNDDAVVSFNTEIALQDDDASLASLSLTDADGHAISLSPTFSSDVYDYTATVGYEEGNSVTIAATANSSYAELFCDYANDDTAGWSSLDLSSPSTINLPVGTTGIEITVEAESESENAYFIELTRGAEADADDRNGTYQCSGYDEDENENYTATYVFTNGSYTYTYTATSGNYEDNGTYSASNGVLTLSDSDNAYDLFEAGSFYPDAYKRTSGTSGIIGTWKSLVEGYGYYEMLTIESDGNFSNIEYDSSDTAIETISGTYSVSNGVLTLTIKSESGDILGVCYTKYVLLSSDDYLSIGVPVSDSSNANDGGFAKQ